MSLKYRGHSGRSPSAPPTSHSTTVRPPPGPRAPFSPPVGPQRLSGGISRRRPYITLARSKRAVFPASPGPAISTGYSGPTQSHRRNPDSSANILEAHHHSSGGGSEGFFVLF